MTFPNGAIRQWVKRHLEIESIKRPRDVFAKTIGHGEEGGNQNLTGLFGVNMDFSLKFIRISSEDASFATPTWWDGGCRPPRKPVWHERMVEPAICKLETWPRYALRVKAPGGERGIACGIKQLGTRNKKEMEATKESEKKYIIRGVPLHWTAWGRFPTKMTQTHNARI